MRTSFLLAFAVFLYLEMRSAIGYSGSFASTVIFIAVFLPLLLLIGTPAKHRDEIHDQKRRNKDFDKRVNRLSRQNNIDLMVVEIKKTFQGILFLRSFDVDQYFRVRNPRRDSLLSAAIIFYNILLARTVPLDDAIRVYLNGSIELLAIGDPGKSIGATRFSTSDDEWKTVITALMESAAAIVIMPSTNPGIRWEVKTITKLPQLLEKAIFILPPEKKISNHANLSFQSSLRVLKNFLKVDEDIQPGEGLIFEPTGALRCRALLLRSGFGEPYLHRKALLWALERAKQ